MEDNVEETMRNKKWRRTILGKRKWKMMMLEDSDYGVDEDEDDHAEDEVED